MATKTNYLIWFSVLISLLSCVRSFLDIDEFKLVQYGIDILRKPVTIGKDEPPGVVYIQSKFGQQYQCSFPDHTEQEKLKEEEEKLAIEIGIPELLRPLETGPCILKLKDWWTYEFCYGKHVRQYHLEDGKITGDIIYLGLFESEFDWNSEEVTSKHKTHLNKYHSQQYVNGTKCDLTGEPRSSEVRFVCEEGSGDYISRIDESETCVYIVTVHTTKICHHPNLKPATHSQSVPITCNPVITEDQYQQYLLDLEEERKEREVEELRKKLSEDMADSPDSEDSTEKLPSNQDKPKNPSLELQELIDKVMKMKDIEEEPRPDTDSEQPTITQDDATSGSSSPETGSVQGEEESSVTDVDEDLDDIEEEDVEGLTSMKQELQSMMKSQVDSAIREAEQELGEEGAFEQERDAAIKKLSQTVDKLLDKYVRTEKDLEAVNKDLKEVNKKTTKIEDIDDDDSDDDEMDDPEQEVKQPSTVQSPEGDKYGDRVKVRITRLKSEDDLPKDPNDKSLQKHVVETTIQDELKESGLDTDGGKIRVKIITAGYYDSDDSTVHVLSEEDSAAFNKMIVAILGGNQEATKEAERHKELEENYNMIWGKNNKKSYTP